MSLDGLNQLISFLITTPYPRSRPISKNTVNKELLVFTYKMDSEYSDRYGEEAQTIGMDSGYRSGCCMSLDVWNRLKCTGTTPSKTSCHSYRSKKTKSLGTASIRDNDKDEVLPCDFKDCDKVCGSKTALKKHTDYHNSDYPCTKCHIHHPT
jgi:hypothetical protein